MFIKKQVCVNGLFGFVLSLFLLGCYVCLSYSKQMDTDNGSNQDPFFLIDNFEYDGSPLDREWVLCSDSGSLQILFEEEVKSIVLKSQSTWRTESKYCCPPEELDDLGQPAAQRS